MMADHARGAGEELEGGDDLRADDGMRAHDLPLLRRQRPRLLQDRLGHADLADVVQETRLSHEIDGGGRESEGRRNAPTQRRHALGVAARVRVLRLQRIRQPEQRLADRPLQLVIQAAHVLGVAQRLLVRRVEATVVRRGISFYSRCHATRGISRSTSDRRRTGEKGLVR